MKTKKLLMVFTGIILFLSGSAASKAQTIADIDGNVYKTVTIGTQTWMAENLKTTKYNDSTSIPLVADTMVVIIVGRRPARVPLWMVVGSGAYCWYNNNLTAYKNVYGALYNRNAVNSKMLCPTGWYVPGIDEWTILTNYLGDSVAGGKLKENDTTHWHSPNTAATNESGFTALPGGYRDGNGVYQDIGYQGVFWSSTIYYAGGRAPRTNKYVSISCDSSSVEYAKGSPGGFSVRCIRGDVASSINNVNSEEVIFYPNPATDRLYLKNNNYTNAEIMIYDLQGKKVLDRKLDSESIDISNLNKGIYIVKLVCPGKIIIKKLIKE